MGGAGMQPSLVSHGLDHLAVEDRLSLLDALRISTRTNGEPILFGPEVKQYLQQLLVTHKLDTLCIDDQMKIAQVLWDSMDEKSRTNELSKAEKMELDLRIKDMELYPQRCLTWEEVRARLRNKRAKK